MVILLLALVQLASPFNACSGEPITEISIIGERCSGTNYLKGLIEKNFPEIKIAAYKYAWKHFYPWLDLTEFGFSQTAEPASFPKLNHSQNCLFIYIVRNPFDWIKSFYAHPHHVDPELTGQGRLHFLSNTWKVTHHPCPDDWNPYAGRPFKNVLELRKFKILNSLKISKMVANFTVIQYEELVESPERFIQSLARAYNLYNPTFINFGKGHQQVIYSPFGPEAKQFILQELDWETEHLVNYHHN